MISYEGFERAPGRIEAVKIYTVELITEADYGCEDTGRTEPMAFVLLSSDEGEKSIEVCLTNR